MEEDYVTVLEASKYLCCTKQAIHYQVKRGLLKFKKQNGKTHILKKSVIDLPKKKHSRSLSRLSTGELVYDHSKGYFSIRQIADKLDLPYSTIHRWIANEYIPYRLVENWIVVNIKDVQEYMK